MQRKISDFDDADDSGLSGSRLPEEPSQLLTAIQNHIKLYYEPTNDYLGALRMTTQEIFSSIQEIFPSESYDMEYISEWLIQNGFRFKDEGGLKFVWLLKESEH